MSGIATAFARSSGVVVDPDAARDAACEVTASSDICRAPDPTDFEPPPVPSSVASAGGGGLGTVVVVLLVVAIVVASAWLIKAWWDGNGGRDRAGDDQTADDELDEDLDGEADLRVIDHETPPDRWRRLAAEHRAGGRHREAIRCEYRGLVGDLARAGAVDEIPGRTSGEERWQVAELAPTLGDDFSRAADVFDHAWFDDAEVTADDDERFRAASGAVLESLRGAVTAP